MAVQAIGTFLAAAVGPLAKIVMQALGLGVIVYVGVDLALSGLLDAARASWGGMAGDVAAYVAMSGGNVALSILAGAMAGRVTMLALKRLGSL